MTLPFLTAVMEEPLPIWQVMSLRSLMSGDELEILDVLAHQISHSAGYEAVGCAVSTVAADGVLLIILIRNSVHIRLLGHSGVERGVEYDYHRDLVAEDLLAAADSLYVTCVVQRSQRDKALDTCDDLVGDELGIAEQSAALDYAVTDSRDLVEVLDNAVLFAEQSVAYGEERLSVIGHGDLFGEGAAVGGLVTDEGALLTDALTVALCDHLLGVHIYQLILQAGAARVDN